MKLRLLLVLPLLLPALVSQDLKNAHPNQKVLAPAGEVDDSGEPRAPSADQKEGAKTDLSNVRRSAAMYCQFFVHAKPARLLPGQSGELIVTAALKGQAVLRAPAPLVVTSPSTQGFVTVGAAAFDPAKPGTGLARGFLGRPVFDNTATMRLPVTVSPDAVLGTKLTVNLGFDFDLLDGESAQVIGQFSDRAVGVIEVGEMPDPAVKGGYTPPLSVASDEPSQPRPAFRDEPEAAAPAQPEAIGGTAAAGAAAPVVAPATVEPAEAEAGTGPVPTDEAGIPWVLIVGGGALLLIVLLLVRRR